MMLLEAFRNELGFVMINGAISVALEFEDPFTINDVEARTMRNKATCLVTLKGRNLYIHSRPPRCIPGSLHMR